MFLRYLMITLVALILVGCGANKEVFTPPLNLQKELFELHDANARLYVKTYNNLLKSLVIELAKEDLKRQVADITDPEGKIEAGKLLLILDEINADREDDLSALETKRVEFLAALDVTKDAYMAIAAKINEYVNQAKVSAEDINLLVGEMFNIYDKVIKKEVVTQ